MKKECECCDHPSGVTTQKGFRLVDSVTQKKARVRVWMVNLSMLPGLAVVQFVVVTWGRKQKKFRGRHASPCKHLTIISLFSLISRAWFCGNF